MKRTILVVDDDDSVRNSVKKLLQTEGYSVLAAADGAQALELFTSKGADLVVMDLNLGEEDGWDVFAAMSSSKPLVPTVVVTAEHGQRDRAHAAGVEALIEKPMDVPAFLDVVQRVLARKASRRFSAAGAGEYSSHAARACDAFRRDLENRRATPLDMSWFDRLELVTDSEANQ